MIEENLVNSISNMTAVSLATGILTEASFPHAILDGFKSLLGASVDTDFVFTEYNGEKLYKDIKEGKTAAPAAAAPAAAAAAPAASSKAAPPPPPEDDDDDVGLGGLF